jgi:hypothetical protein
MKEMPSPDWTGLILDTSQGRTLWRFSLVAIRDLGATRSHGRFVILARPAPRCIFNGVGSCKCSKNLAPRVGFELFPTGEQRNPLIWGEAVELGIQSGRSAVKFRLVALGVPRGLAGLQASRSDLVERRAGQHFNQCY